MYLIFFLIGIISQAVSLILTFVFTYIIENLTPGIELGPLFILKLLVVILHTGRATRELESG